MKTSPTPALLLLCSSLLSGSAFAAAPESPFVFVAVDKATEAKLGPFPYGRERYAKAVATIKAAGAKAVVLKYFLDSAKPGGGDDLLAKELRRIPSLLQARIDPEEPKSNSLPEKFYLKGIEGLESTAAGVFSGDQGWLPIPKFAKAARRVGFVDVRSEEHPLDLPVFEVYRGRPVPSLVIATLEEWFGERAKIRAGKELRLHGRTLPLTSMSEVTWELPKKDGLKARSFLDLVEGRVAKAELKGKIVVLGYEGTLDPKYKTAFGQMGAHRMFVYCLEWVWGRLTAPIK